MIALRLGRGGVVAMAVLAGCTPARREITGDVVQSVTFLGNGGPLSGHNDYQLQSAMAQGDSGFGVATWPLLYLVEPEPLDLDALSQDAYRLEVWYAHHGWFDARVDGFEIHRVRPGNDKRAGMVRVIGHVEAGEPSVVRSFDIEGLDTVALAVHGRVIRRTGYVVEGAQFDLESTDATRDQLLSLLGDHGYPYATVDVAIEAEPDEHAVDVRFTVDAGPSATFGPVRVQGNRSVDTAIILDSLTFETGAAFDRAELGRSQRRLFDLGTFAIVNLEPDLSDRTRTEVPITVKVTETKFQSFRLGGGVDIDSGLVTPRLSSAYTNALLFDRLIAADASATVGYALGSRAATTRGVGRGTYSVQASVSTPRLAGPKWGLHAGTDIVRDVQSAQYTFFNPQASVKVTWQWRDWLGFDAGPSLELYRILDLGDQGRILARTLFGPGFDDEYALITMDAGVTADWRDDPLDTTRGSYYRFAVRQSLPGLGDYLYTDLAGEGRTYSRVRIGDRTPFTLAGRARARLLVPHTDAGVPYPERSFLGGSANLRGFRSNQVGPYETLCTYVAGRTGDGFTGEPGAGDELTRRYLPAGGEVEALVSGEARVDWAYGISIAPFVDAGLLAPSMGRVRPEQARVAGGVGFRYASLVGPIRVDFAVRPLYPEDRGPARVLGCRPADAVPRSFDAFGMFPKQRAADTRAIPFALNISIAIGQAF